MSDQNSLTPEKSFKLALARQEFRKQLEGISLEQAKDMLVLAYESQLITRWITAEMLMTNDRK